ncbi:MAG: hypothetical protein DLM73_01760 [Chthoniobacterales bacterium]|nr:MAG: hypothetical protein DLM73_01760 [Chthoniobacterales bacterium]
MIRAIMGGGNTTGVALVSIMVKSKLVTSFFWRKMKGALMRMSLHSNKTPLVLFALALVLLALACRPPVLKKPETSAWSGTATSISLRGEEAIKVLKAEGSYESLAEAMAAAKYAISPSTRAPTGSETGAYEASNPAQGLQTSFTGKEVRVVSNGEQKWQIGLELKGYGRGETLMDVTTGPMKALGNRIEYARSQTISGKPHEEQSAFRNPHSAILEWYVNTPAGLE